MTELSNEPGIKARKPHICTLCDGPIQVGETYRRWTGRDGGVFVTGRYHEECDALTVLDGWDHIDWESFSDTAMFMERLKDVRDERGDNWWKPKP